MTNDTISVQRTKEKLSHLVILLGNSSGMPEQAAAYAQALPGRIDECLARFFERATEESQAPQASAAAALTRITEPLMEWLLIGLAVDFGNREQRRTPRSSRTAGAER